MEYPGRKPSTEIRGDRPMIASQSKICANEAGTPDGGGLNNSSSRVQPLYNGIVLEI